MYVRKTKQSRVSRCVPLVATMAASGPVVEAPDTAISLERIGAVKTLTPPLHPDCAAY